MRVLDSVTVIKVKPKLLTGKYKIGQHMSPLDRIELAQKIFKRNSPTARETLRIMGFDITENGLKMVDEPIW